MLVGFRINASMLLGMLISWVIAPYALMHYGVIQPNFTKNDVLFWVMWPATALLVSSGLAALVLRWRILARTFRNLSGSAAGPESFPLKWVITGVLITSLALIVTQKLLLGLDVWMTVVAVLLSLPMMLVGLRVLGETNWGPVSVMSNLMQAIFGLLAPGQILPNMLASGTTGTIAAESEGLMQDYKAGYMIGSTPKDLTIMQLLAVPVGAAAVSWMYPLLRNTYGIVGEHAGLSSPLSRKWAGFAELLSRGLSALPAGAMEAVIIASLVGILLAVLESRNIRWVPSPTGIGIAMLVPAAVILMMFIGGAAERLWHRADRRSNELHMVPLASGFIAGEAIIAVIIPLLVVLGIVH